MTNSKGMLGILAIHGFWVRKDELIIEGGLVGREHLNSGGFFEPFFPQNRIQLRVHQCSYVSAWVSDKVMSL